MNFIALFAFLTLWLGVCSAGTKTSTNVDIKVQRKAVKAWAKQLTDQDYNATHWAVTMRHQPQNFFDHYIQVLSDIFAEKGATVNFALVGACDGTHDATISGRYLPNKHWRGVFVEPFEMNYKDLVAFMDSQGVGERTYVLHAAATRQCNESMIKMKRPMFEERNKSLPHWMRRQIGAVVPFDKLDRPATGVWTFEMTRCVNGPDILRDWARTMQKRADAQKTSGDGETEHTLVTRIRPHILKVDVEGHDYEVLMGFLDKDTPSTELPLVISFEAKSIKKNMDNLRAHLESRGYVVSHGNTNDGFALLKASVISGKSKKYVTQDAEEENEEGADGEGETKKKRKGKKNKRDGKKNKSD